MKRLFVGDEGRVRSGWVVATFGAVAGLVLLTLTLAREAWADADKLGSLDSPAAGWFTWPTLLAGLGATAVCHRVFAEGAGLALEGAARRFGLGLALSAAVVTAACVVPSLVGVAPLHGTGVGLASVARVVVVHALCVAPTAVGEELLLRGVPLRALARGTNPSAAVAVTGGLFGLFHLLNPGASLVAALNVALVGAWFGAVAWRTGSLWMSCGLHVGWNFTEGVVFGQPVSGLLPGTSLLASSAPAGPGFFHGGAFGPEAAGWTAVLLVLALAVTLAWPGTRTRGSP